MKWPIVFVACQLLAGTALADFQRVRVADPYVDLRSGPGRSFPIIDVAERDTWLQIVKRRTDWFLVRNERQREGWVARVQMESTITEAGLRKSFRDVLLDDYLARRLELGFAAGDFDGDPALEVRAGYRFNDHLLGELTLTQVAGTFSSSRLYTANLLLQPFADWRVSPYFTLGVGRFENTPKVVLVDTEEVSTTAANAGVGVRTYLTRRFVFRVAYRNYLALVDDARNEEFSEWVAGISFFF